MNAKVNEGFLWLGMGFGFWGFFVVVLTSYRVLFLDLICQKSMWASWKEKKERKKEKKLGMKSV